MRKPLVFLFICGVLVVDTKVIVTFELIASKFTFPSLFSTSRLEQKMLVPELPVLFTPWRRRYWEQFSEGALALVNRLSVTNLIVIPLPIDRPASISEEFIFADGRSSGYLVWLTMNPASLWALNVKLVLLDSLGNTSASKINMKAILCDRVSFWFCSLKSNMLGPSVCKKCEHYHWGYEHTCKGFLDINNLRKMYNPSFP